jgi:hypothetical protein
VTGGKRAPHRSALPTSRSSEKMTRMAGLGAPTDLVTESRAVVAWIETVMTGPVPTFTIWTSKARYLRKADRRPVWRRSEERIFRLFAQPRHLPTPQAQHEEGRADTGPSPRSTRRAAYAVVRHDAGQRIEARQHDCAAVLLHWRGHDVRIGNGKRNHAWQETELGRLTSSATFDELHRRLRRENLRLAGRLQGEVRARISCPREARTSRPCPRVGRPRQR